MRDDDPIGCAGYYRRISASTLPLCFGCPAYARQSPIQIAPLAKLGDGGVWGCEAKDRLLHGGPTVGLESLIEQAVVLGPEENTAPKGTKP